MEQTVQTTYKLTQEEIKQAIVEYMESHDINPDIKHDEIRFDSEMSDPKTFGTVSARINKIK